MKKYISIVVILFIGLSGYSQTDLKWFPEKHWNDFYRESNSQGPMRTSSQIPRLQKLADKYNDSLRLICIGIDSSDLNRKKYLIRTKSK